QRDRIRQETRDLLHATGTTAVLVTHDPDEALRFGDAIALVDHGRLVQTGRPDDLYWRPVADLAARAFGDVNEFLVSCRDGHLDTPVVTFAAHDLADDNEGGLIVGPQHVRCSSTTGGAPARVVRTSFLGDATELRLRLFDAPNAEL